MLDVLEELFLNFVRGIVDYGLEKHGRYYSSYRGIVEDNGDPEFKGRVMLRVPMIFSDEVLPDWAHPKALWAGPNHGVFFPPINGSGVWVGFENGDPRFPFYEGGWWAKEQGGTLEMPSEFQSDPPQTYGIVTPGGHAVTLNDKDGEREVLFRWKDGSKISKIGVLSSGTTYMEDHKGNKIYLTADDGQEKIEILDMHGNKYTSDSAGLRVVESTGASKTDWGPSEINNTASGNFVTQATQADFQTLTMLLGQGATEPLVLGTQTQVWWATVLVAFLAHTHPIVTPIPGSPTGPSQSPLPPMPPTMFSVRNKTV